MQFGVLLQVLFWDAVWGAVGGASDGAGARLTAGCCLGHSSGGAVGGAIIAIWDLCWCIFLVLRVYNLAGVVSLWMACFGHSSALC